MRFKPRRFAAVAVGLALAGTLAASAWAASSAGSLDTSFGGTGYVTTPIGDFAVAQGVTNYDGGKTVAVGLTDNGTDDDFAVARYNKDGSLDIYVQPTPPRGHESNWIPDPPHTQFILILRMYGPNSSVINGTYTYPQITRVG